jgi:hypothetical protein
VRVKLYPQSREHAFTDREEKDLVAFLNAL